MIANVKKIPIKNVESKFSFLLAGAFGLCLLYWTYLFLTAQTEIFWDSVEYQNLGEMLYHQGWLEYFRSGPNREPLYPFFISIAMRLANIFHAPYIKILVLMQFVLLFITQIFTFKILNKLKIPPWLTRLIILYIGFSPALINCTLSLYSEILIISLITAATYVISDILVKFNGYSFRHSFTSGILLGTTFIFLTLTKGVFELVSPLILLSSLVISWPLCKQKKAFQKYTILIIVSLVTFSGLLFAYKSANKHYNGNFTLTNRGSWAFYGYAARRAEPLTTERLLTALAYVPGEGACKMLYGEEKCYFWSIFSSDSFGMGQLQELTAQGLKGADLDKTMLYLASEKIQAHPFQYFLLTGLEAFKIFFWESTQLAFVTYPQGLTRLYDNVLTKNFLRLIFAVLSLAGTVYALRVLWTKRIGKTLVTDEQYVTLFFILSMVFFYTALYSFFLIGTRYAVPVAPLFLCLIAMLFQSFQKP